MDISIIIPNYNGEALLKKNLPRVTEVLGDYKGGKTEIILVDDGSTDNSVLSIKNYVSSIKNKDINIKVLINEKNMGFSSAVNRGAEEARGEIIILLNTDVVPEKDFLNPLLKHFDDEKIFAVGCLDKSIEGGKTVLRGRGLGQWSRGFLVHRRGEVDKNNTLWVSGGSGAFRKSVWEKLGGLNELYNPFYYEDIDISYRAVKSGYKIMFEPKSIVTHYHEEGAIKSRFTKNQIKTIAYRNQFIFVWENATDYRLQALHFIWLPYHLFRALIFADFAFLTGFFKALYHLPKVIQSSLKAQKLFVLSDKEVIQIANT